MKSFRLIPMVFLCTALQIFGQTGTPTSTVVPRLVNFSGQVRGANGKPLTGQVTITFSLYLEQQGGSPLWSELQTVQPDTDGHYSVFLGAANATGLPLDLFTSGSARWLAVRPEVPGMEDPARILLVGVPYALKAADADTLGGRPASAYLTTESPAVAAQTAVTAPALSGVTSDGSPTGSGTTNYIPIWTSSTALGNSILYQSGNNLGIGNATPAYPLSLSSTGNTFPSGVSYLSQFVGSGSGNSGGTTNYRGLDFEISATGGNPFAGFTSITGDNFNSLSAGTVAGQSIFSANLRVNNAGNTTSGFGFQAIPILTSKGGITSWEAFDARTPSVSAAGGAIATAYGIYLEPQQVTGVTTGYGLYQVGTSDKNYLAGNVGIGTKTPGANLEVNGTAKFDGAVTFGGSITGNLRTSGELVSTVAQGTAPLQVISTTQVANLNASLLGGLAASSFPVLTGSNTFKGANTMIQSGSANYSTALSGQASASNGQTIGLNGATESVAGIGVLGQSGGLGVPRGLSSTGQSLLAIGVGFGVWGDSSTSDGLVGTSDASIAGYFQNNSNNEPTLEAINTSGVPGSVVAEFESTSSNETVSCFIDYTASLYCSGSKSAVVPVDSNTRKVALYAVESPENWFEDFGSGQLINGFATVQIESTFAQTVNTDMDYRVFITANGESGNLYVSAKTSQSFEVREAAGGKSNIAFDYRIVARRKGYEAIRLADKTKDSDPSRHPIKRAASGQPISR